ncbi:MAG: heat-inducible transcriptional repressor HrcA [Anaerolineae bacterium]|nr:heat-inducible transcriptional repressor HrcA [Anaerolineae bacterium]
MSDDTPPFPELTRRQQDLLALIVRTYTENPRPVSSQTLIEKHELDISSATVRNEMVRLEEMGYIVQPHTSAGRIPTTLGYRYFVRHLMQDTRSELTLPERRQLDVRFRALPVILEQWLKQAATMLAHTTHSAALVTPPVAGTNRFKHIELISIQGRLALMVLVLQGGMVHQRMLNLAEAVPQPALSEAAAHINALFDNLSAGDMRVKSHSLSILERDVTDIITELMERGDPHPVRSLYRDGLSSIINSFPEDSGRQQAVRLFEERALLDMILTEVLLHPVDDEVQVVIAGDGRWNELSQVSMVLSHYGIPGQMSGALGVIGPTSINYPRAIGTVRHIAGLMSEMLLSLYSAGSTPEDDSPPPKK